MTSVTYDHRAVSSAITNCITEKCAVPKLVLPLIAAYECIDYFYWMWLATNGKPIRDLISIHSKLWTAYQYFLTSTPDKEIVSFAIFFHKFLDEYPVDVLDGVLKLRPDLTEEEKARAVLLKAKCLKTWEFFWKYFNPQKFWMEFPEAKKLVNESDSNYPYRLDSQGMVVVKIENEKV